ncbi:hypothetical protein GQ55_3G128400 [Panicum hallii var. hallii]|uniref:Uncharacterized protein n=1 Tax=Panicum hallii var. hallii TaxID=1504633 RepID=A0A2T7E8W9_9POAL|nr:hypothetical protein GQ55_3G128400 [Panicum hallii var. hallii]
MTSQGDAAGAGAEGFEVDGRALVLRSALAAAVARHLGLLLCIGNPRMMRQRMIWGQFRNQIDDAGVRSGLLLCCAFGSIAEQEISTTKKTQLATKISLVHRRCQNRRPAKKVHAPSDYCPFSLASCLLQLPGAPSSGRFCTCRRLPRRGPRSGHSVQGTALPTAPTPSVPHRTRRRRRREGCCGEGFGSGTTQINT